MKRKLYSLEEALKHPKHAQELTIFLAREKADLNRIGELHNLKSLALLDSDQLTEIPEAVYELAMLQSLRLRSTAVKSFSEKLGQLKMLNRIEVSNTPLESLPEAIGQLQQLQTIYLRETSLKELPLAIGNCQLQQISIWKGQLSQLPDTIGSIKTLTKLDLQNNPLDELPASFGQLENLDWLNLNYNRFVDFPKVICQLPKLKGLFFDHNGLSSLPEEIKQLKELTNLTFSHNQFQHFPLAVLKLEKLNRLNLSYNQIDDIPENFFELKHLNYLDIRSNAFQNFPLPLLSWYMYSSSKNSRFNFDQSLVKGKDIFAMMKGKTFQRLSQEEKEAFFHIYVDNKEEIQKLALPTLWKALNTASVDVSAVTLAYMTEQLENKKIQKGDSIYVAGKLTMDQDHFEQQMDACELTISKKLEDATHVLISARSNKKPRKWPQKEDWSWISEAQLMAFFDEINPSFLVEAAETDAEKVSHFIMSMDEDNMALGMGLIEGGGLPEELFTEAFIVYKLAASKALRDKAKELLKAKASPELLTVIKNQAKLNRKGYLRDSVRRQLEQRVKDYAKDGGLDLGKLAYAVYINNGSCLGLAMDHVSSPLRLQLLQRTMSQGELYLSYRARLRYFPQEILDLQGLQKLTIYAEMGRWEDGQHQPNTDFKIPEDISKLESLEYLHISFNFDSLPIESLKKLPKLQQLSLNVRSLDLKKAIEEALPNCKLNIYHYKY
jgi:Leucine-rich repeat (LRR) protein